MYKRYRNYSITHIYIKSNNGNKSVDNNNSSEHNNHINKYNKKLNMSGLACGSPDVET